MGLFFLLAGAGMVAMVWHAYHCGVQAATTDHRQIILRRGDTVALSRWNVHTEQNETSIVRVTLHDRTAEGHKILRFAELRRDPAV